MAPCLHRLCALYGECLLCRGQGMPAAGLVGLCSGCDTAMQETLRDMCLGAQIMQGERGVVAHVTLPHAHELARYDTLELDFALGCPGALPAPSRAVLSLMLYLYTAEAHGMHMLSGPDERTLTYIVHDQWLTPEYLPIL